MNNNAYSNNNKNQERKAFTKEEKIQMLKSKNRSIKDIFEKKQEKQKSKFA